MKPNLLYIFLLSTIVACSNASLKSHGDGKDKGRSNQKSSDELGEATNGGSQIPTSSESTVITKGKRAIPPEEVTGSYLACEVYDSGPGAPGSSANVGCNAIASTGSALNLADASTKWTLTDPKKAPLTSKVLGTSSRYQMAWSVSHVSLVAGFEANLELNAGLSAPIVNIKQDHKYDRFSKLLSDGRAFSVAANLPSNGLLPDAFKDSTLSIKAIERPFQIANYSVTVLSLDPLTGYCSRVLAPTNLTLKTSTVSEDILNMTSTFVGTGAGTSFCLEIRGTFTIGGKQETAVVYQR